LPLGHSREYRPEELEGDPKLGKFSAGRRCQPTAERARQFIVSEIHQWATIGGTTGYLHVSDFVLPWCGSQIGTVRHAHKCGQQAPGSAEFDAAV